MSYFLAIIISLLLSALFSGMEIAFVSSNKLRLEISKKKGGVTSQILSIYTENPGQYIVTMLIGNNIALVVYGIIMAMVLEPVISTFTNSDTSVLAIQTILSTLLILLVAEFIPKAIFRINANGLLKIFSIPIFLFYLIFYPISKFTIWLSRIILRVFMRIKLTEKSDDRVFGKPDLDYLVNEAQEDKNQDQAEDPNLKIFQNALDLSNVKLRECMIPRTELVALEETTSVEELRQIFIESGLSKILIFKKSIDNIIGYVNMKDLFGRVTSIKPYIVPLDIVPESMHANKLLKMFVDEKMKIALVVDEFGGTSGIVTIEDILEEIFGEITDEHDTIELIEKTINENEYVFSGRLEIDYLNEKYKLKLPKKDDFETLAGLIFYYYESIPKLNQHMDIGSYNYKVLKVSETRIELVQLNILDPS